MRREYITGQDFFGVDAIFLNRSTYTNPNLASTIAHEVGYYLELDHTHQYSTRGKCRKEAIDRNRTWPLIQFCIFGGGHTGQKICEMTGDFLRDTPADHDLNSNFSCSYILTGATDPWGDHYDFPPAGSLSPDTRNILSYNGLRGCRNVFTRLQIAVMLHSIERGKSSNNRDEWKDLKAEFDEYESDNTAITARLILPDEKQERNFHQQIQSEDLAGHPIWGQCDVDWVRFVPSCNQTFTIETSAITGKANANTRLTVFDNTLNQLAQNDDISVSNHFSKITLSLLEGETYFIRVENMGNQSTVYYILQVNQELSITGNDNFCTTSGIYSVEDLPVGSTVTWSAYPSGRVIINSPNSTSTTLTKLNGGNIELTATVNNTCGSTVLKKSGIIVGTPNPGTIDWLWDVPPHRVTLSVEPVPGATSYNWYLNSNFKANTSTEYYQLPMTGNVQCGQFYYFAVAAVGTCGTSEQSYIGAQMPECDEYLVIMPNPASDNVIVSLRNDEGNTLKSKSPTSIQRVEIIDKTGVMKRSQQFTQAANQVTISVSGLPGDVYTIRIFDGKKWHTAKIIVQR